MGDISEPHPKAERGNGSTSKNYENSSRSRLIVEDQELLSIIAEGVTDPLQMLFFPDLKWEKSRLSKQLLCLL